jgi:RNA polymerase sigma-70 factor (ECF subfamily)
MSETELVRKAKEGDRDAFAALVRLHQPRVFALGMRWFRNASDADDLVQETFVRVWTSRERIDADRPFAPWVITIAVNRAKTMSARARNAEELDESLVWEGPSPEEDADRARLAGAVQRGMAALPEDQRVVLHLRAVDSLSYREIAGALDVPIGTVMSRLARARESLRRLLGRAAEGDVPDV